MKVKTYLFRFAVAFTAFIFGVSFLYVGRYFQSVFSPQEQKISELVKIENHTFPQPFIEQLPTPVIEETSVSDSEENTEEEFDASGDYWNISDTKKKGLKELWEISILTTDDTLTDDNEYKGNPIAPEGFVYTRARQEFKFTRINIGNKQITFQTETKKGISYKFVGKFLDEQNYNKEDFADIEGRLITMRNSKKITEVTVRLRRSRC
jgi:hypothetical protein